MKTVSGVLLPISAYHLTLLYICTNFQENISKSFRVIERTPFAYENFKEGTIL